MSLKLLQFFHIAVPATDGDGLGMLKDKTFLVRGFFDINRDDSDSFYPGGKIEDDRDVMIEQNRCEAISSPEADTMMEKRGRLLDNRPEFRIRIRPVGASVVVAIG